MFEGLSISIVNAPNHTKCILLSNQKCMIQPSLPSLINLHPNEYSQEFYCYPFVFKLYRCIGNCNTLNDLSNKVCVSNKTDDFNLSMFSMITGVTKHSIALTNIYLTHVSKSLMEENISQITGGKMISVNVSVKNFIYVENIILGILLNAVFKMENI